MLLLDQPLSAGPLTVYPDHASGSTFHYLPGVPRLVEHSGIALTLFRGGQEGGLLTLDVDLALSPADLAAGRAALAARIGSEPNLVPVLFDAGTVRLTVLDATSGESDGPTPPRLVERVLATAIPSVLGSARAVFGARLDPEGAVALQAGITAAHPPLAVVYELEFRGLRPASGLRVSLDYAMAYDYLRTRAAGRTLWFRADLDRETEALERAGHVAVTDVDYTGSDPEVLARRRDTAVALLRETVAGALFRPATSPATVAPAVAAQPAVAAAWAAAGGGQAAFLLRSLDQTESQQATYDRTEASVGTARIAPQGALPLPSGVEPASVIRLVDLAEDLPPAPVRVTTAQGADWTGVAAVQVEVSDGDQVASVVLTAAAPDGRVVPLGAGPRQLRIRVLAEPGPGDLGVPPTAEPGFAPLDGETVLVDPAAAAGRRLLRIALGAAPGELVSEATVDLATTDGAQTSVTLTADHPEALVPVWGRPALAVEARLQTSAGEVRLNPAAPAAVAGPIVLNLPRDRFRTVQLRLQDPLDRLAVVDVELEAADGTRARRSLDPTTPAAAWVDVDPEPDGPRPPYRFRTRMLARDGGLSSTDWTPSADSLLVVGDRDVRVDTVTVVLAGWNDPLGAMVALTAVDPAPGVPARAEALLTSAPWRATLTLAGSAVAPMRYAVSGQVFLADRVEVVELAAEQAEVLLLTPDTFSS